MFEAVVDATEEAVLNALWAAPEVVGREGRIGHALPHDDVLELLAAHGRLEGRLEGMATFLHTMVRDHRPRAEPGFYEALGFRFSRDMDIVRNGELEATNYFFSSATHENVLELTYNHDGRTYELGTAYGHIAIGVDDLDGTLAALKRATGSSRSARRTR